MTLFRRVLTLYFLAVAGASAQVDQNTNGMSDVWEAAFGWGLIPTDDPDLDGYVNREESFAGTDPGNASSHPRSAIFRMTNNTTACVNFPSEAGIQYQIESSPDLITWYPSGNPIIGNGLAYEVDLLLNQVFIGSDFTRSVWTGLNGYGTAVIKSYVSNNTPAPHVVDAMAQLEIPQSNPNRDQFGHHIRGWLIPPQSGFYTLWLASDDSSELWLSTNGSPASKNMIASVPDYTSFRQWTKYSQQQSAPVYLLANQSYYLEVFHRESWGGDHLSVAWTLPSAPLDTREIIAAPYLSTSGQTLYNLSQTGNGLSFRLKVNHADSDNDGVTDYEEDLLGLNPENPATTPRQPDDTVAQRILESPNGITIGATVPRAYEEEALPGQFTVYRAGGIEPLTIHYTVTGSATTGVDYAALPGTLVMPAGHRTAFINIFPIDDGILETGETVVVTLQTGLVYTIGSPSQSSLSIDDSMDVLYVAQLRPAVDVTSSGFGLASVRRTGNGLSSKVSLSFSALAGNELAAEIFISTNGLNGPVVLSLPMDQVSLLDWTFTPANGISSNELIQALDNELMWIRIKSSVFSDRELIGRFVTSPGWLTMPQPVVPPPAPMIPSTAGEASRFLTQATFGPNSNDVASLMTNSYAQWIDHQLSLPPTLHLPYVQFRRAELYARDGTDGWQSTRQMAWWQHALTAPDQLRQRMAWALSQIFVVSQFGALDSEHVGTTVYYDHLVNGAFGNYRDLLEQITLSPMMGIYLSMMRNQKPDIVTGHEPDENYAREVMQLLAIGLTEMHTDGSLKLTTNGTPIATYSQADIVGLAHIFTGWSVHYDTTNPPTWDNGSVADPDDWFFWGWDSMRPMSFYGSYHDTSNRIIVGNTLIPAGTNGVARMDQALDALFNHPNVGPFIARQLIQRFVTSNPGPGYIHRVASIFNDNGNGVRGDLGATLKAVLLDYEARSPDVRSSASYGKPIEPVMRMTRMLRALPPTPPFTANGDNRLFLEFQYSLPEQVPLYASSVFNFYQPGYRQPGRIARSGLLSPEFQIYAETTAIREANMHFGILYWGIWTPEPISTNETAVLTLNIDPLVAILQTPGLTPAQAQALLVDYMDERFLFGAMSPELRTNLESFFASLPGWFDYSTTYQRQRVQASLYLLFNSPEFLVQR
jgi:uncharacterized protein (DUF1800 family)